MPREHGLANTIVGIIVGGILSAFNLFLVQIILETMISKILVDSFFILISVIGLVQDANKIFKTGSIITLVVAIFAFLFDLFLLFTMP